jgi:hypothetical protein
MIPQPKRNEKAMRKAFFQDLRFGPFIQDPHVILQKLYDQRTERVARQKAQAQQRTEASTRRTLDEIDRLNAMVEQRMPNLRFVNARRAQLQETIRGMT